MVILPSMHPCNAKSLALFCAVALLAIVVAVLIAPDLGPPDTAFQTNPSLVMARHHQTPRVSANTDFSRLSLQIADSSIGANQVQEIPERSINNLTVKHEPLRC